MAMPHGVEPGYDFVVVGAGSAGCVLASGLARRTEASVLLVEGGGPDDDPRIRDGALASVLSMWGPGDRLDWGYTTVPQPGLAGRTVPIARGRVWGGSSSVNAMVHVRGNRRDYDGWARLGAEGWDYASVLPLLRRMEDFAGGADEYRGAGGPLRVAWNRRVSPVAEALFDAGSVLGLRDGRDGFDYNAAEQAGSVFYYQATKNPDGSRCGAARAYLRPALDLPNLTVLDRARVTGIVTARGRATAIEYTRDGEPGRIAADREIILSAGAFASPHLLMLSGIGPAAHLREHGVAVLEDLPGVGANLQDHMILPVASLAARRQPEPAALIAETGFFTHTRAQDSAEPPGLQMKFGGLKFVPPDLDREGDGFTFAPVIVRPHSRGSVTLAGPDPAVLPVVDPGYLIDRADVRALVEGLEMARELAAAPALRGHAEAEIAPGPAVRGRPALEEYVRGYAGTLWHPVGTCRMGAPDDPGAVLDPRLRVRGVAGLRVADASVMPRVVAGNTNAACLLIGEKAADLIIEELESGAVGAAGRSRREV
jgi:choline dehydrogenase